MDERDSKHQDPADSIEAPPPEPGGKAPPAGDDEEYQRSNPDSVARYYEKYYANPYYSGPQKRGWPVWATVLIVVLVVMIGGCSVLIYAAWRGLLGSGLVPNIPPAAVHVGTQLTWREIDSWQGPKGRMSNVYSDVGLHAADFTGDGEEELLLGKPYSGYAMTSRQIDVYDIQNAACLFSFPNPSYSQCALPWDYNGDGVMDLALDSYTEVLVLDQAGSELAKLTGSWQGQEPLAGDIDGDGSIELLLHDYQNQSLNAFDDHGNSIWAMPSQYAPATLVADIDSDGCDELIVDNGTSLDVYGMNQQPAQITGFHAGMQPYSTPSAGACLDLNGDGAAEIISGETGYFDIASNAFTQFNWPAPPAGVYGAVVSSNIAVYDLDSDGTLEIAVAGSRQTGGTGTGLHIFDLSGNLVYYEEFGSYVHGFAVGTAGGQEHLCVLLSDRLIVYP